ATFTYLIGKIDVAWRVEIVTSDGHGRQRAHSGVGDLAPGAARQQQRMQAHTAVGRADPLACALAPCADDTVDRPRVDPGPVAQHDDRSLDLVAQRGQAAAPR